jgi:endo-1,4-beta-xylanase
MAEQRDWGLVQGHFERTIGRYGNSVCEWEVVNEAIDSEAGEDGIRRNCFQRAFGNGYIAQAFRTARALAPHTPLLINEYSLEYRNPIDAARRARLLRLLEALKSDGVPIDGVGLQAHLELAKGPLDAPAIRSFIREIAGMDLTMTVSELDVLEADRRRPLAVRDKAAADEVRRFLDIVLAEPAVRGVVTWGLSDRDSWLQDRIERRHRGDLNRGLPFDAGLEPKPLYWALRDALAQRSGAI